MKRCPYCEDEREVGIYNFNQHLLRYHTDEYDKQVELVKKLFNDYNFSEKTLDQYPEVVLSYNVIRDIWKKTYTDEERKERMIQCTKLHNQDTNKGRISSLDKRKKMSVKRIEFLQTHRHRSINGFRPDIGHNANSTYEANIYRIFQLEGKRYKREQENIFEVTFPDGSKHNYIIDICDVDGLFDEPGTYIEIKGYMDDLSLTKINAFRQQYPQHKLIVIGNKYQKNYIPDIDYRMLENKYQIKIPLWETTKDHIKSNPQKWNIDKDKQKIEQKAFYCPECGLVQGVRLVDHIKYYHEELYEEIVKTIKELFYDKNFVKTNIDQYKDKIYGFSMNTAYRIWKQEFGEETVNNKRNILNPKKEKEKKAFINCPICGQVHSKWLFTHIKQNHEELYKEIMELIKKLFYDKNFVQDHIDQYKDKLYGIEYTSVYQQWKEIYGSELVSQRTKLLKHPGSFKMKPKQEQKIPGAVHNCSICGEKNVLRIASHIKFKHPEEYVTFIKNCEKVYYDVNFTEKTCASYAELYGVSYNTVQRQWAKKFGRQAVSDRMKIITCTHLKNK